MSEMSREELLRAEAIDSEQGWVAPLTHTAKRAERFREHQTESLAYYA